MMNEKTYEMVMSLKENIQNSNEYLNLAKKKAILEENKSALLHYTYLENLKVELQECLKRNDDTTKIRENISELKKKYSDDTVLNEYYTAKSELEQLYMNISKILNFYHEQ